MKLIIKNNLVVATSDVSVDDNYLLSRPDYDGCIVIQDNDFNGKIGDEYIVTVDILKQLKLKEIDDKAYYYQQNGTVEYKNCVFEMSITNRKNLSDTVEALTLQGKTSQEWNSKDDTMVELTIEDIQKVRLELMLGKIQKIWIASQPYYKKLVKNANTVEDLNFVVDYSVDIPSEQS